MPKTDFSSAGGSAIVPTTKVVAANNSIYKSRADSVCDGTADDVEIQAALDALFGGTLTLAAIPSANQTFTIGSDTYTFKATRSVAFEVTIGANATATVANMLTAFNTDNTNSGLVASVSSNTFILASKQVSVSKGTTTNLSYISGGGGEVVLLEGTYNIAASLNIYSSGIVLSGVSRDGTIVNCGSSTRNIAIQGVQNTVTLSGVEIRGLTIQNSTNTNGAVYMIWSDNSVVEDCFFTGNASSSGNAGDIKVESCKRNIIRNNIFNQTGASGRGIYIVGNSPYSLITSNQFYGGATGLTFIEHGDGTNINQYSIVSNNICTIATASSRFIKPNNNSPLWHLTVIGNVCTGSFTFCYDTNIRNAYLIGNVLVSTAQQASSEGIVARQDCLVVGNVIVGTVPVYPYYIISTGNVVSGNIGKIVFVVENLSGKYSNNHGNNIIDDRESVLMINTSGGSLALGDVVVLKSVAAGNEVTTTTTAGDKKVFGMALGTIANSASGEIAVLGKTTALKVDGTTDIAIGDHLSTHTVAGIAKKASAGETAFAIALEAYATNDSAGVIDALLISPRSI